MCSSFLCSHLFMTTPILHGGDRIMVIECQARFPRWLRYLNFEVSLRMDFTQELLAPARFLFAMCTQRQLQLIVPKQCCSLNSVATVLTFMKILVVIATLYAISWPMWVILSCISQCDIIMFIFCRWPEEGNWYSLPYWSQPFISLPCPPLFAVSVWSHRIFHPCS